MSYLARVLLTQTVVELSTWSGSGAYREETSRLELQKLGEQVM